MSQTPEGYIDVGFGVQEIAVDVKKAFLHEGLVYGIVYEPNTVDAHGDWTSKDEIRRAAHTFLPRAIMNLEHIPDSDLPDVEVVESYVALTSFTFAGQKIKEGTWLLATKVNNEDLKKAIERGEITGYSLEGSCQKLEYAPVANAVDQQSMVVQSLVFSKAKFASAGEVVSWARHHKFAGSKVDETENSYRVRQFDPEACQEGTFRTKGLTDGVQAIVCRKK